MRFLLAWIPLWVAFALTVSVGVTSKFEVAAFLVECVSTYICQISGVLAVAWHGEL